MMPGHPCIIWRTALEVDARYQRRNDTSRALQRASLAPSYDRQMPRKLVRGCDVRVSTTHSANAVSEAPAGGGRVPRYVSDERTAPMVAGRDPHFGYVRPAVPVRLPAHLRGRKLNPCPGVGWVRPARFKETLMRTSIKVASAVVAVGAALVLAPSSGATPTQDGPRFGGRVLEFDLGLRDFDENYVDIGTPGPGVGDLLVFQDRVGRKARTPRSVSKAAPAPSLRCWKTASKRTASAPCPCPRTDQLPRPGHRRADQAAGHRRRNRRLPGSRR